MTQPSWELEWILRDLNSWWDPPHRVRPDPPAYRRRGVEGIRAGLGGAKSLVQVVRGPRQVGKTTALYQVVEDLLEAGTAPRDVLLVRFDLQPLREIGLLGIHRWYREHVREGDAGGAPVLLLDEVHKLERWDEEVKHLSDTFPVRMVLTGSSSVLVARGQRESLAGRALTVDFPPFQFREVLEAWHPEGLEDLPPPMTVRDLLEDPRPRREELGAIDRVARSRPAWRALLDRYYLRGGYPRLHSGEVPEDRWADYLVETVFERVLGADIPDLFPVEQPGLLRHIYLELARRTGQEVAQNALAQACNDAGFRTGQPLVGRYMHYLADALLIREFRRYPLARSRTARVPAKITLTDLGMRNAIFRGAPSLWDSPPEVVGPLVETLIQSVLGGPGLQTHFYRARRDAENRRSPFEEVDFVVEDLAGAVLPVEVKFRRQIRDEDLAGMDSFLERFGAGWGIVVTREEFGDDAERRRMRIPLLSFLLAF